MIYKVRYIQGRKGTSLREGVGVVVKDTSLCMLHVYICRNQPWKVCMQRGNFTIVFLFKLSNLFKLIFKIHNYSCSSWKRWDDEELILFHKVLTNVLFGFWLNSSSVGVWIIHSVFSYFLNIASAQFFITSRDGKEVWGKTKMFPVFIK